MTLPTLRLRPREMKPSVASKAAIPPEMRGLMEAILPIASHRFGIPVVDLIRQCRKTELVRARAFVVWALRSLGTPLSYPVIGSLLGDRDHTSMIHLHEKAIRLRLCDADFDAACIRIAGAFQTFEETIHGNTSH